jgi:hypothetical protein
MANANQNVLKLELARFRKQAFEQLGLLTGLSSNDCRETYLFEEDRFCGVRWTLGNAKASWRQGSTEILYQQDQQSVVGEADQQVHEIRKAA